MHSDRNYTKDQSTLGANFSQESITVVAWGKKTGKVKPITFFLISLNLA